MDSFNQHIDYMHKGRKARLIAWQMNPKIKFIQTYNKFIDGSELKSFLARCHASRSKQNAEHHRRNRPLAGEHIRIFHEKHDDGQQCTNAWVHREDEAKQVLSPRMRFNTSSGRRIVIQKFTVARAERAHPGRLI